MTEEIIGALPREDGGVFRGQITYATILKNHRWLLGERESRKYQIFRGQMSFATIFKNHRWALGRARKSQIQSLSRPYELKFS